MYRNKIIEGAAHLFRIYGIKSVTMDTIANHLGISKRTIYEVFSDKDELLVGVLQWMTAKQNDLVTKVLTESDNAVKAIFMLLEINRDHFRNMSPAFQQDLKRFQNGGFQKKEMNCEMPDFRNHKKIIERGIEEKLFRADIDADFVNRCLYLMGSLTMDYDLFPLEDFSRSEVIRHGFINYLRGISTPAGLDLINDLALKY